MGQDHSTSSKKETEHQGDKKGEKKPSSSTPEPQNSGDKKQKNKADINDNFDNRVSTAETMIGVEFSDTELDDAKQRSSLQGISTDLMMEEIARRRLEELGRDETRERLIHAIEEVDRDVEEVYIPRRVFHDMINEFDSLWNSTGPIWRRILRILTYLLVFILNLLIVVIRKEEAQMMIVRVIGKVLRIIFKYIGLDGLVNSAIDVLTSLCITKIKEYHRHEEEKGTKRVRNMKR